jgi:GTP-binding protein
MKKKPGVVILGKQMGWLDTISTRDYEEKIKKELMPFTDVPILLFQR